MQVCVQVADKTVNLNGGDRSNDLTRRLAPWALAGICAIAFFGASWLTANLSPLRPDTASYLYFDPSRPIGYPAFLSLISFFGGPVLAVPVQMVLLAISLFLLGWSFYRWTGSAVLSVLFQLALVASPEMWKFAAAMITEAPATAAVALWCAQLLNLLLKPSARGLYVLAAISGVAVLVKPALLPMFISTAVAAFLLQTRKERTSALVVTGAALALTLAVTPLANLLLHGSPASGSPVARGILQHTLFCPPSSVPADPDSAFVEQYSRTVRDYIEAAPDDVQPALKRLYTGKLRFGLIIPTLGRRHGLQAGWQTDELIGKIARERLGANVNCYVASVIDTYLSLATYDSNTATEARRIRNWLNAQPPPELPVARLLPQEEILAVRAARDVGMAEPAWPGRQEFEAPTGRPLLLVLPARALYGSAAIIGLAGMLLVFAGGKLSPDDRRLVVSIAALGITFHGVLGLTALVELHLTRYTVPVWPVVCTLLALAGVELLKRSKYWVEGRRREPAAASA